MEELLLQMYRTLIVIIYILLYICAQQFPSGHLNLKLMSEIDQYHDIIRPDVDILLMSNCKYHMDINTWAQSDV